MSLSRLPDQPGIAAGSRRARRMSRQAPRRLRARGLGPVERLEDRSLLATLVVTNTADSGPGSLRQAILDSNATPGPNTIDFNVIQEFPLPSGDFTIGITTGPDGNLWF